ncbi:sigma factor [Lentzea sp. DG1S-22]|nr:sigma factor [Lentzea sp. DG1S-22]WVH79951.1 sigma factor [Lentzea sp. DG1S-22]
MSTPEPDQGFAEFFRRCLPVVTRTLTALNGDTRVVEDIAQDALVIAQHRWHDVHAYDKPEAWVLKVAIRLMRRWQQRHELETPLVEVPDVVQQVHDVEALHSALRELSPAPRGRGVAPPARLLGQRDRRGAGGGRVDRADPPHPRPGRAAADPRRQ